MENFLFALGYTFILLLVATQYYFWGKDKGIKETIIIFNEHEPEAFRRMHFKLRGILGVTDSQ